VIVDLSKDDDRSPPAILQSLAAVIAEKDRNFSIVAHGPTVEEVVKWKRAFDDCELEFEKSYIISSQVLRMSSISADHFYDDVSYLVMARGKTAPFDMKFMARKAAETYKISSASIARSSVQHFKLTDEEKLTDASGLPLEEASQRPVSEAAFLINLFVPDGRYVLSLGSGSCPVMRAAISLRPLVSTHNLDINKAMNFAAYTAAKKAFLGKPPAARPDPITGPFHLPDLRKRPKPKTKPPAAAPDPSASQASTTKKTERPAGTTVEQRAGKRLKGLDGAPAATNIDLMDVDEPSGASVDFID